MRAAFAVAVIALSGCFSERERPTPAGPDGVAELSVRLLAPTTGATVPTGEDVTVEVEARDLNMLLLEGVGFVARRLAPGMPLVDSAAVRFPSRSDTVHAFTFTVPGALTTNTQLDIYGIAFGPGGTTRLSEPSHLVVVHCENGVCQ
jgi:hypothetical protein